MNSPDLASVDHGVHGGEGTTRGAKCGKTCEVQEPRRAQRTRRVGGKMLSPCATTFSESQRCSLFAHLAPFVVPSPLSVHLVTPAVRISPKAPPLSLAQFVSAGTA